MAEASPEQSRTSSAEMERWQHLGVEVNVCLRALDYESAERLAAQLCERWPHHARGWLLRRTLMQERGASAEELLHVLQEGVVAAEAARSSDCAKLLQARETVHTRWSLRTPSDVGGADTTQWVGEWDCEGCYVYQAFPPEIADYALAHQMFGGPNFNPSRMTWIKPSFGWILYRSGYGQRHGKNRVLKIKLPHDAVAVLLRQCRCVDTNKATQGAGGKSKDKHAGAPDGQSFTNSGGSGCVQWDPERDMLSAEKGESRKMLHRRAIQVGLAGRLSELYVRSVLSIEDVTGLCHRVRDAHVARTSKQQKERMEALAPCLPAERPYLPACADSILVQLGMLPGERAEALARLGRGKAV